MLFFTLAMPATAGEFSCLIGCDLGGISTNVEWKPSSSQCYKPSAPLTFVSDARSYNQAVREFNRWIDELDVYLSCVRSEAKDDLEKIPDIMSKGLQNVRTDVDLDVSRARATLQAYRP